MNKVKIKIKRLSDDSIIPSYQTDGSAGFDFHTLESVTLEPNETILIRTGLSMKIVEGFELQVRPRSGLSFKTRLRVANSPGTVDSDYRGEIKIILTNTGFLRRTINKGDRIAQGVICPVFQADFEEVEELDETERGNGGFGSSGV